VTDLRRRTGARAEIAVADYLEVRGFQILAHNLRLGPLEIDLVARAGTLAVMVEVRTRSARSFQGALESITARKRALLVRAAERLWRERLSQLAGIERMRLDVAAVTFEGAKTFVEYIEGAFTA
jgi:putative endonuclease